MQDSPYTSCLSQAFVDHLADVASRNTRFKEKAIGLYLTFGMHDVQSGACVWLRAENTHVRGGVGEGNARFTLAGTTKAWDALCQGFPINRLIRQEHIKITGDARCCMQNWLAVYFLMAGARGFKI